MFLQKIQHTRTFIVSQKVTPWRSTKPSLHSSELHTTYVHIRLGEVVIYKLRKLLFPLNQWVGDRWCWSNLEYTGEKTILFCWR